MVTQSLEYQFRKWKFNANLNANDLPEFHPERSIVMHSTFEFFNL